MDETIRPTKPDFLRYFDEGVNPESDLILIRNLNAAGIIKIMEEKGDLNSFRFDDTSFHLVNTANVSVGAAGYGSGGSSFGSFVVFPDQIKKMGGIDSENITNSQVGLEYKVPSNVRVTNEMYLFVTPDELPVVIKCKSKLEALEGIKDRKDVVEVVIEKAKKHLETQQQLKKIREELHRDFGSRRIEEVFFDIAMAKRNRTQLPVQLEIEGGSGIKTKEGQSILIQNFEDTQTLLRDYKKIQDYLNSRHESNT